MTTTKFKASEVYNYMKVGKRTKTDETYYYFNDETPEEMREQWQELTGGYDDHSFADLDEYYSVLYTLVQLITEHEQYSGDNTFDENELYNIDWRDDYNGERLMWVYNNLNRAYIYDEVKNNGADSLFAILGDMQDLSRGQFANYIYNNFLEV